jgi:serine/threonine protein kinase
LPFFAKKQDELFARIKLGKFSTPDSVSKDAIDLLKKMLNTSPNKRISAKDAI